MKIKTVHQIADDCGIKNQWEMTLLEAALSDTGITFPLPMDGSLAVSEIICALFKRIEWLEADKVKADRLMTARFYADNDREDEEVK